MPLRSLGFVFTYCRVQYLQPQPVLLISASLPVAVSPAPRRRVPGGMSISKKPYLFAVLFRTQTFTNPSQGKIPCTNLTNQEIRKKLGTNPNSSSWISCRCADAQFQSQDSCCKIMFFTHLTFKQQQCLPIQIAYLPIYNENMP